jgi:hypothetical protein
MTSRNGVVGFGCAFVVVIVAGIPAVSRRWPGRVGCSRGRFNNHRPTRGSVWRSIFRTNGRNSNDVVVIAPRDAMAGLNPPHRECVTISRAPGGLDP